MKRRSQQLTTSNPSRSISSYETIISYMNSREIYRNEKIAILVDAFRHIRGYMEYCQKLYLNNNNNNNNNNDNNKFKEDKINLNPISVLFFLSHFHSDHYSGITENWEYGIIYASRATANILCSQLGVKNYLVKRMDFSITYFFSLLTGELLYEEENENNNEVKTCYNDYFSVKIVPANHCPGAVMFLFYSPIFGTILHCGDFRFSKENMEFPLISSLPKASRLSLEYDMSNEPILKSTAGKLDTLFLDNTFCDPRFNFPARPATLAEVNKTIFSMFSEYTLALQSNSKNKNNKRIISLAVLIGTYSIGKERIALSIQETFLPKSFNINNPTFIPIYVSPEKYKLLKSLNYYLDRFTPISSSTKNNNNNNEETNIIEFNMHEIKLPQEEILLTQNVARNLFSSLEELNNNNNEEEEEEKEEIKYYLTIFLVPMSSVSYLTLSKSNKTKLKQENNKSISKNNNKINLSQEEILPIWENKVIELKKFDAILCVEPTGWNKKVSKQKINNHLLLLRVPYSEHCNFSELLDFVEFINPKTIIPSVSLELFKKYELLFAEKAPRLRQKYSNVQPISKFLNPKSFVETVIKKENGVDNIKTISVETQKQRNPFAMTNINEKIEIYSNDISSSYISIDINDQYSVNETNNVIKNEEEENIKRSYNNFKNDDLNSLECNKDIKKRKLNFIHSKKQEEEEEEISSDDNDCVIVKCLPNFIEISDSSD